jgi:hypothetical protein
MNIIAKLSALALLCGWQLTANATTQENVYDFANNNLNLEVATPADWEDPTKGVISGQELRQGDVVLTSVDGAKPNRMWRTNAGVTYLQVGGKITITADEGRAITGITFEVQNYKFFLEAQAGNGELDATNYVWNGNSTAITFDNENAANEWNTQSLLLTMTVTTNDANDETYTPDATTYVEVSSIAEFNALEVGTLAKLTLNNAQVNGVDWSTAYVEDASAAVEFDGLNLDLECGDILNGYIYVKRGQFYYDEDPDDDVAGRERPQATNDALTSADTYTKTSGNELQPTLFTMAELLNDANFSKLVALNSVAISLNGRFYIAEADGLQVRVNDMLGYLPQDYVIPENGELCNITGIFSWNGLAYQIYLTSIESTPTSISNVNADKNEKEGAVFDIMGRQMQGTLPAGIYIKNGHKFIVR